MNGGQAMSSVYFEISSRKSTNRQIFLFQKTYNETTDMNTIQDIENISKYDHFKRHYHSPLKVGSNFNQQCGTFPPASQSDATRAKPRKKR